MKLTVATRTASVPLPAGNRPLLVLRSHHRPPEQIRRFPIQRLNTAPRTCLLVKRLLTFRELCQLQVRRICWKHMPLTAPAAYPAAKAPSSSSDQCDIDTRPLGRTVRNSGASVQVSKAPESTSFQTLDVPPSRATVPIVGNTKPRGGSLSSHSGERTDVQKNTTHPLIRVTTYTNASQRDVPKHFLSDTQPSITVQDVDAKKRPHANAQPQNPLSNKSQVSSG